MPFKSNKQRRFLFLKKPEIAREFAKKAKKQGQLNAIKRKLK